VLGSLAVEVVDPLGWNVGLLELANQIIIIWLIYRLLVAILELILPPDKAWFWSRKVLFPLFIIVSILRATNLLDSVLGWGIYIDTIGWRLTIGSVLLAAGIVIVFVGVARWVREILANSFLPEAGLEPALANTVSIVVTYIIVIFGVLVALGSVGINLSTLTVVLGGLSVGLAFGLQEIVNNFVSGFILLFERSVQIGDIVQVDDNTGAVQKIGIRSTTIKTRDNIELIIPNSYFLTQIVTNMTRSEDLIRTRIAVGVSYEATPQEVEQALLEAAAQHPDVLSDPPPSVQFMDFGSSSLDFELFVWTNQAFQTPRLTSELRFHIWDALAARNIEIPFPQRDIHIRSGVPWSSLTPPDRSPS
jgi:potassium efflux system protein